MILNESMKNYREDSGTDYLQSNAFHDQGLPIGNFKKIAANGLGEDYNAYPHAMIWFQGKLIVCVTRAVLEVRGRMQKALNPDHMGAIWPVKLPDSYFDLDLCAQIWSYSPHTKEWKKNYTSPLVLGNKGIEVPLCRAFRVSAIFKGKHDHAPALYIPSSATTHRPETVLLKSYDGEKFEIISEPGLGICPTPRSLRGLVPFQGRLFTSPVAGKKEFEHNISDHMIVLVSDDPEHCEWKPACEPNFGNPNNLMVFEMAEFNDCLYAGTGNVIEGFEIWKTEGVGEPPFKWKKIITQGAYRGNLSQGAITLHSFGEHLYVGTGIQGGGWDLANNIGPAAAELIRINKDDSWELVIGEARHTPDGFKIPLGGLGPGFGDLTSGYFWSICSHQDYLYVGNLKWFSHVRYADRTKWPAMLKDILNPSRLEELLENFGGCSLWRSRDGCHWQPVTLNGFGNFYNYGIRSMVSSPYGLFVGTANPYTPEVAVKRLAGWQYEKNCRGGLEVWQGTKECQLDMDKSKKVLGDSCSPQEKGKLGKKKYSEKSDAEFERMISDFFQTSNFRHFGLWRPGIDGAYNACENLMEEILAHIGENKEGPLLDISCGRGATTWYLQNNFSANAVTGITAEKELLPTCKQNAPSCTFLYSNLPKVKLPSNCFRYVVWVKGLQTIGDREILLSEVFRVLKPGGQVICFDLLSSVQKKVTYWNRFFTKNNTVRNIDEYGRLFDNTGFEQVDFIDVTSRCLPGFRRYRAQFLALKRDTSEIDNKTFAKMNSYFCEKESAVQACLLLSAYKPLLQGHDKRNN